jgi:hypothetical protein
MKIYIASIIEGDNDHHIEIASPNKELVESWVYRFNNIVSQIKKRLVTDADSDNPRLWEEYVMYYNPLAVIKETELL